MVKKEEEEIEEEIEEEEETGTRDNGHKEMTAAEEAAFEKKELAKAVPGWGHLFHVDPENLHEASRLNQQAIFGFAARDMQQAVLDPNRTMSAWDIFKFGFMGYMISLDGEGRTEAIALHHLSTEEKEAAVQGGLYDKGK